MWALDDFVVNIRVVPAKALEIITACFKDWITEDVAIAVFRRILTVDHPVAT